MSIWDIANKVDELQAKISCVKHILELVASELQDPHSGAVWACRDMLDKYGEELELQVNDLMDCHTEMQELKEESEALKAKPKKKNGKKNG